MLKTKIILALIFIIPAGNAFSCISCNLQIQDAIFNDQFLSLLGIMVTPSLVTALGLLLLYFRAR